MEKHEIISAVKDILGIGDDSQDIVINLIVSDCINAVISYCRLEFLPSQLESYIPFIASRIYRMEGIGSHAVSQSVKSMTEGNRSITYEQCIDISSVVDEYKSRLKPFVNRKGRVPSDLL